MKDGDIQEHCYKLWCQVVDLQQRDILHTFFSVRTPSDYAYVYHLWSRAVFLHSQSHSRANVHIVKSTILGLQIIQSPQLTHFLHFLFPSSRDHGGMPIHIAMRVPLLQTPTSKEKLWSIRWWPYTWGATSSPESSHCHRKCSTMKVLLFSSQQLKYSAVLVCQQYTKWTDDYCTTWKLNFELNHSYPGSEVYWNHFTNGYKLSHHATLIGVISVLGREESNCTEHSSRAWHRILSRHWWSSMV